MSSLLNSYLENHIYKHIHVSQLNSITGKTSGINFVFTNELEKTLIPVVTRLNCPLSSTCIVHIQMILLCMFHVDLLLCPGLDLPSRK